MPDFLSPAPTSQGEATFRRSLVSLSIFPGIKILGKKSGAYFTHMSENKST